jgi:hypothetical protein
MGVAFRVLYRRKELRSYEPAASGRARVPILGSEAPVLTLDTLAILGWLEFEYRKR